MKRLSLRTSLETGQGGGAIDAARFVARRALALALLLSTVDAHGLEARVAASPSPPATGDLAAVAGSGRSAGRAGALPDSVLARVGHRDVTVSRFLVAWRDPSRPTDLDSLTPQAAARFLEVLIDRETLVEAALRKHWQWTPEERTAYADLADRLALQSALEAVLESTRLALRASGDTVSDAASVGVAARERTMKEIDASFDRACLARLTRAFSALPRPTSDSSLAAQLRMLETLPTVDPADTAAVIARSSVGEVRVSELLRHWQRLHPLYRPQVQSEADLRGVIENGLFETWLRRESRRHGSDHDPRTLEALAKERERIAVAHLLAREVEQRIVVDSLALVRFYRDHAVEWALPTRLEVLRLVLPGQAEATRMALRLRDAADAESLAAVARRSGTDYLIELSAADDSAFFARASAAGVGTVLGPDSTPQGWAVSRLIAILPPRVRSYGEVRDRVARRWYTEQGERLLRELIARERRALRVRVNQPALRHLSGLTAVHGES